MHKIFISHSSKDKEIVEALIDELLVGVLGVKAAEIFCTSVEGMKIESGSDWRDYIRKTMTNVKVTILILTPNYKESEICLNEMGAAWALNSFVLPVTVEPINWKTAGILHEPKQLESLNNETSLDRIYDRMVKELNIDSASIKSDHWTRKKRIFLSNLKNSLKSNPFPEPIGRKEYEELLKQKKSDGQVIDDLALENSNLKKMIKDLEHAKDKIEVKKIKAKYSDNSDWETFEEKCDAVTELLNQLRPILCGVVFNTYSHKGLEIRRENYQTDIDKARARDYIDEDLNADWETSKFMRNLRSALVSLENFMTSPDLSVDFIEQYDEKYDCPFELSNFDFWEDVLGVKISID